MFFQSCLKFIAHLGVTLLRNAGKKKTDLITDLDSFAFCSILAFVYKKILLEFKTSVDLINKQHLDAMIEPGFNF